MYRAIWTGFSLVCVAGYFLQPVAYAKDAIWSALLLGGALACVLGVRAFAPRAPYAWHMLAMGLVWISGANTVWLLDKARTGRSDPDILASVALQLVGTALAAAAFVVAARGRSRSEARAVSLDTLTVGTGVWLLVFLVVIDPATKQNAIGVGLRVQVAVFTYIAVTMAAVVVRSLTMDRGRNVAAWSMTMGALFAVIAVANYGIKHANGTYHSGDPVDVFQLLSIAIAGFVALSPWMREFTSPSMSSVLPPWEASEGRWSLLAFGLASPLAVIVLAGASLDATQLRISLVAYSVMFVATLARISDLLATLPAIVQRLQVARDVRARLLQRTVSAAERERLIVSGELHDGPVQSLAASAVRLGSVQMLLSTGQVERAGGVIDEVCESLLAEVGALRTLMHDLRPPELEQYGLEAAVRGLATRFGQEATGTRITVRATSPLDLPASTEIVLFRIAQEALANAARHSGARRVALELGQAEAADGARVATITIDDDGRGFDPSAAPQRGHFGLDVMRERVELAGGRWQLDARPGAGVRIVAQLPVHAGAPTTADHAEPASSDRT